MPMLRRAATGCWAPTSPRASSLWNPRGGRRAASQRYSWLRPCSCVTLRRRRRRSRRRCRSSSWADSTQLLLLQKARILPPSIKLSSATPSILLLAVPRAVFTASRRTTASRRRMGFHRLGNRRMGRARRRQESSNCRVTVMNRETVEKYPRVVLLEAFRSTRGVLYSRRRRDLATAAYGISPGRPIRLSARGRERHACSVMQRR